MRPKSTTKRLTRTLRTAGLLGVTFLVATSACTDEVGGDGYQPPKPASGGSGGVNAGGSPELGMGGAAEGGAAGAQGAVGNQGGKGGSSVSQGGKGGTAVTGMAGQAGETSGSVCGNMIVEAGEECDDGNTKSGDGCTADCKSGCEVCEKTYCTAVRSQQAGEHQWTTDEARTPKDLVANCYDMPGDAKTGPASGTPRAELCQAMVDCIRREKCAQIVADDFTPTPGMGSYLSGARDMAFLHCFCARDVTETNYVNNCGTEPDPSLPPDQPVFVPGKCKREIQEASEKDQLKVVLLSPWTGGLPLGVANLLLQACDKKLCTEECLPAASVGVVAQITADISRLPNAAGESPLGSLVADSQRAAFASDFALVASNGITSTFNREYGPSGLIFAATPGRPADADGRVLESEVRHVLFGMDPVGQAVNEGVGSALVSVHLTGQQVYDVLNSQLDGINVSGLTFTWDATLPRGTQVTEVRQAGTPIDKAASYAVAMNDQFLAVLRKLFSGNFGADATISDKDPEQELVRYLQAQPQPIAPPALGRITRLN